MNSNASQNDAQVPGSQGAGGGGSQDQESRNRPPPEGNNYTSGPGNMRNSLFYRLEDSSHPFAGVNFSYERMRKQKDGEPACYYLRCAQRKKLQCKGRACIQNGHMKLADQPHTCLAALGSKEERLVKVESKRYLHQLKNRAADESTKLKVII